MLPRTTPVWRYFVVLLAILGHFGAQFHSKAIAHRLCASHPGEYCHAHTDEPNEQFAATDRSDETDPAAPNEPSEHHEHCPILPIVAASGDLIESGGGESARALPPPARGHHLEILEFEVPTRAPLEYAPKTSPPALS